MNSEQTNLLDDPTGCDRVDIEMKPENASRYELAAKRAAETYIDADAIAAAHRRPPHLTDKGIPTAGLRAQVLITK
ncbi:hypothetical protein [Burkholderia lata]|uniref:hypothetical protein n=1 Tax=Burkholderia lata (strain ATCC 17760 / DSM 23089 / LMG 22485 / NCIMB 9086 / R18194 / 383) TaxID=482957 RepID=UPI0018D47094|nr:hypothetical protein [Burkholderia lata]